MKHAPLITILTVGLAACSAPADPNSPFALSGSIVSVSSASSSGFEESSSSSMPSLLEGGTWYSNNTVGYSILIPKEAKQWSNLKCSQMVDTVPVVTVEDGADTAITRAFEYTDQCAEAPHDLTWLRKTLAEQPRIVWHLQSKTIASDAQLDAFIKERYGKDCSLGEKIPAAQEGTFDVGIDGFGPPEDGYDCFVNYITELKYSPAKKKIVYWDIGQEVNFQGGPTGGYDTEMTKSFRFE